MEKTLVVLNDLVKKGLIKDYVIAGGIALLYYAEPVLTYDLDVFCRLPTRQEGLVTLSPIYAYLQEKGYRTHGEHMMIEGVPVQFIPAYNELVQEGLERALEITYGEVKTRIVRVEYLLAIMLQTYRPKDRERMLIVVNEVQVDVHYLEEILQKHGLQEKWNKFRRRYAE